MTENWITIGNVSVDTGSLMIADPCYLTDINWTEEDAIKYGNELCEDDICSVEVPNKLGHKGKAVIFGNFGGDGSYEVKALKDEHGRIKEVKIILIED